MAKRSTKRALLASVLSLVLCLSMLIGTTFAWFTDSVASTNNIIKSGRLDVKFEYSTDLQTWNEIGANTNIFKEGALWEPGYTEVVYLKVSNKGNLAFKFRLGINVASEIGGTNVYNEPFNLSDYIYFGAIGDVTAKYANREEAIGDILQPKKLSLGQVEQGYIDGTNTEEVIALVVYMPTSIGNVANYKLDTAAPEIHLGLDLQATQYTYEADGFATNDYDKFAEFEGEITTAEGLAVALAAGGSYVVKDNITVPAGMLPTVPEGKTVVLDLNGYNIIAEDTANQYAFANLGNLTLLDSKAASGASTFRMRAAAPVGGSVTARGIYNGRNADNSVVNPNAKITVLSGTYNAMGIGGGAAIFNSGIAELKGGTFTSVDSYAVNVQAGGKLLVDGATITGGIYAAGAVTVNSGEISNSRSGCHAIYATNTTITMTDGVIHNNNTSNSALYLHNTDATINGGTVSMANSTTSCLIDVQAGSKLVITNGSFKGAIDIRNAASEVSISGGVFEIAVNDSYVADGVKKIVIDGVTHILPSSYIVIDGVNGLYKDAAKNYFVYTAEGFDALHDLLAANTPVFSIHIMADIDMAGYPWSTVDMHQDYGAILETIDGHGHTISNLFVSGQAMFRRFSLRNLLVIKDITFESAEVVSGALNTSILTVQNYSNLVLDNVDVVNSSITGAYKVAPLVATHYDENGASSKHLTVKNCDVSDTLVKSTTYDFFTTGMVSFVYNTDGETVSFENCTITNVTLDCARSYDYHAFVYCNNDDDNFLIDEVDGVTVTNCKVIKR